MINFKEYRGWNTELLHGKMIQKLLSKLVEKQFHSSSKKSISILDMPTYYGRNLALILQESTRLSNYGINLEVIGTDFYDFPDRNTARNSVNGVLESTKLLFDMNFPFSFDSDSLPKIIENIEELESKTFDLVCLSNTDHDLTTKYTIEVLPKVLRNECYIISDFILIDNDEFRFDLIEEMSSVKRFKNGNENKQSLFLFQVQKNKIKSKDFKSEVKDSVNESKTFSKKEK